VWKKGRRDEASRGPASVGTSPFRHEPIGNSRESVVTKGQRKTMEMRTHWRCDGDGFSILSIRGDGEREANRRGAGDRPAGGPLLPVQWLPPHFRRLAEGEA